MRPGPSARWATATQGPGSWWGGRPRGLRVPRPCGAGPSVDATAPTGAAVPATATRPSRRRRFNANEVRRDLLSRPIRVGSWWGADVRLPGGLRMTPGAVLGRVGIVEGGALRAASPRRRSLSLDQPPLEAEPAGGGDGLSTKEMAARLDLPLGPPPPVPPCEQSPAKRPSRQRHGRPDGRTRHVRPADASPPASRPSAQLPPERQRSRPGVLMEELREIGRVGKAHGCADPADRHIRVGQ